MAQVVAASGALVTTVLVVRHAESVANAGSYFASQSDSPLSERGLRQVEALTRALDGAPVHAVYSSDLQRARNTVAPLALARGIDIDLRVSLRERHMGEFTGLSFAEARSRYPEAWARLVGRDPASAPPGGESHIEVAARVGASLAEILAKHPGQTVVIGSHGVAIHHMVRQLMGVTEIELLLWLAVDNASVSRIDLLERPGKPPTPRLVYVNRVAPLDGERHLP